MNTNFRILAASLASFFVVAGPLAAAVPANLTLFGVSSATNQLVSIDPATGEGRVVGSFGESIYATDVAVLDERLFTFDQVNDRIREINKVSGRLISSIDIGVPNLVGEGALAFRADGTGFLASPLNAANEPVNDFYMFTIDPDAGTGTSERLGSTGVAIDAMAFGSTGTLYAIGQGTAMFYTINTTTGAALLVGSLGPDVTQDSPISGMTVVAGSGGADDEIYAAINDRLYTINPNTGAATPVSEDVANFGPFISSISGLALAPGAATFGNMSTRLGVGTGDDVGIGGFIIRGTPDKRVLVRGIGPSLPVSGTLADPVLELFNEQGVSIATNDDYGTSRDLTEIRDLDLAPRNPKESVLIKTLPAGAYTAVLSGKNGTTGIGLVELYDVEPGNGSMLANLSTRGVVRPGDNTLIGGLIISGSSTQRIVFRAIGPDLANRGVEDVLADPNLEVFDRDGNSLAMNDNYATDPGAAQIENLGLTPNDPLESATIMTLSPGEYTVVVRGVSDTSGVALVESYNVTAAVSTPPANSRR